MIAALINLIIYLVIVGIVFGLAWWVLDQIGLPEPINRWIRIAVVVIIALVVILLLLQLVGAGSALRLPRFVE